VATSGGAILSDGAFYRDQWIDEALANYLALLFADSQKNANHSLRVWLARYRQRLVEKFPNAEQRLRTLARSTWATG